MHSGGGRSPPPKKKYINFFFGGGFGPPLKSIQGLGIFFGDWWTLVEIGLYQRHTRIGQASVFCMHIKINWPIETGIYKLPKIFSQFTNCLISQIDANIYIYLYISCESGRRPKLEKDAYRSSLYMRQSLSKSSSPPFRSWQLHQAEFKYRGEDTE